MALLFPQCSLPFSAMNCSNKGNNLLVHGSQMRVTRLPLKKGGKHVIRCEATASTVVDGGVPGSAITPAESTDIKRSDFPVDFKFGASTSAIQTEGPPDIGGRGPSTWDFLITQGPYYSAALSYKYYPADVKLLKDMGMDVYRFSISWSRILPNGKGNINQEGIDFYNKLINELLANGIQPFVTLFHMDLPTALQNDYNGFLGSNVVVDFKNYCDICFKNFGDRVKFWGTINEPDVYAQYGYIQGLQIKDDPARYPYTAAHNIILAHATVVKHYKENYQATQGGIIGMTVSLIWFEPYTPDSKLDGEAARRALSFHTDLFVEPLVYGDYPFIIKSLVRDRLPAFTTEEKEIIKGAYDFVGVNYYTSRYAQAVPFNENDVPVSFDADQYATILAEKDGKPIGQNVGGDVYMVPNGLRDGLVYLKEKYLNPAIYITENGCTDVTGATSITEDDYRITFIRSHIIAVQKALAKGASVKSYIVWSHIDVVELGGGYGVRLGLNHTDYSNFERTPKNSAKWFTQFLNN